MHPFCTFLQALAAKEIESLRDGLASNKSCKLPNQSIELIDQGKSPDLSAGGGVASSPSPAASSSSDSQLNLEPETLPLSVNHTLKKGMPHYIVCNRRFYFNLLGFLVGGYFI